MKEFESLLNQKEEIEKVRQQLSDESQKVSSKLGLLLANHLKDTGVFKRIDWSIRVWHGGSGLTLSGDCHGEAGDELINLLNKIDSNSYGYYHFAFKLQHDMNKETTLTLNDRTLSIMFNSLSQAKNFLGTYKISSGLDDFKSEIADKEKDLEKCKSVLKQLEQTR